MQNLLGDVSRPISWSSCHKKECALRLNRTVQLAGGEAFKKEHKDMLQCITTM